ncbi:MAG: CHAT domain-containing protein [Hyphomicrobiales bacterium]
MQGGRYQDALRLAQERVATSEQESGPNSLQTAAWLNKLGILCNLTGDYDRAEQAFLRSLEIKQKSRRTHSQSIAVTLLHLLDLYITKGDYPRAEQLLQQALDIRVKALGSDHPDVGQVMAHQGRLKMFLGEYAAGEALNQRALDMTERAYGPDANSQVAACLDNLSEIRRRMGDLPTAEGYLRRALAIREKPPRPDHPLLAREWNNLAQIAVEQGKYAQAEADYTTALSVYGRSVGTDHPAAAHAMSNLAALYTALGNYSRSETLQRQALEIFEATYGPYHFRVAKAVEKTGALKAVAGDHTAALQCYRRALDIVEITLGSAHPEAANCLDGMGSALLALGNYSEAGEFYRRALSIREQAFGSTNIHVAQSLLNLARFAQAAGEFGQAQTFALRALSINESAFGPNHPRVAACLEILTKQRAALHDYAGAFEYGLRIQAVNQAVIDQAMDLPSEDLKLRYLTTREQSLHTFMSLVAQHLAGQPSAVRSVFDVWLKRKGLILDSQKRLYEGLRDRGDSEALKTFQELEAIRARMSTLAFSPSEQVNADVYRRQMEALELEKEKLNQKLVHLSREFALQRKFTEADAETIAATLPARTALVEFARVNTYNFDSRGRRGRWLPARYLAFVLHAGHGGDVHMVDLGDAGAIDDAVTRLKTEIASLRKAASGKDEFAQQLYQLVFRPLETELGTTRDIFLAPDGNLNLIPFEVLRGRDGRFLIEDYTFNYLAAGRDILAFKQVAGRTGTPLLMGDPDFDLGAGPRDAALKTLALKGSDEGEEARRSPPVRGMHCERLPGTRDEILAIRQLLGTAGTESYLGAEALEEVLQAHSSPRILHLATHGFFLEDVARTDAAGGELQSGERGIVEAEAGPALAVTAAIGVQIQNPLLRSGIALAGANREGADAAGGAGIVTAEEILGMNLWGTEMVVLSACETGLGEVHTGEGVYGLRRAFTQAGAKSMVMSMWSVPDAETKELMIEFYRGIQSGKLNRCQALRQAALKEMAATKQRRGEANAFYWGAFVFMGEP